MVIPILSSIYPPSRSRINSVASFGIKHIITNFMKLLELEYPRRSIISLSIPEASIPSPSTMTCGFCKKNKEREVVYQSHNLKDSQGNVVCPQLSKYVCNLCGSTGKDAHTRSYCPTAIRLRTESATSSASSDSSHASASGSQSTASRAYNSVAGTSTNPGRPVQLDHQRLCLNMGKVTNSRFNSAGRLRSIQRYEPKY